MADNLTPQQEQVLARTVELCRQRSIIIPTYRQMAHPEEVPAKIKEELKSIGLWDIHPRNLFRITWKNEPRDQGGLFGSVNYLEIPSELSGVPARIVVLTGKFFPTGAHKVGATFGPLVERLITGRFDPSHQKALWPSTGNYCRGGAFNSALLGCGAIAVLPEEMSRERFEWLESIGAEVIRTPGGEANVKEIYDKVKELKAQRGDEIVVLNQFEEMGNSRWHYAVTGPAMEEVFQQLKHPRERFAGLFLTQGSAGTLGSGDYLREVFPGVKIAAGEAAQVPTLLYNGYGAHRIEGIGDKHVPWIMNVKNLDMVIGIDDRLPLRLLRLFNEPEGKEFLRNLKLPEELIGRLDLFGISGLANLIGAIKLARYYELTERDFVFTVATDSVAMYHSRLLEMQTREGPYSLQRAELDFVMALQELSLEHVLELSYYDKRRLHNLKYFTWVEQQGKTTAELDAQWYEPEYWSSQYHQVREWDKRIEAFNERVGLLKT